MEIKLKKKRTSARAMFKIIESFFREAEKVFRIDSSKADRLVRKAVRISNKARRPLPPIFKKRFCRHCGSYWSFSSNVRVRLRGKKVVYSCLNCKSHLRHPYVKEKKMKQKSMDNGHSRIGY